MDAQNERLGWLNKHAPQILASPNVSPQSRDQHVGKLRAINLSWSKVRIIPTLHPTSLLLSLLLHHSFFHSFLTPPFFCRWPMSCWIKSGRWRPTCKIIPSSRTGWTDSLTGSLSHTRQSWPEVWALAKHRYIVCLKMSQDPTNLTENQFITDTMSYLKCVLTCLTRPWRPQWRTGRRTWRTCWLIL